ncbi:MarR family winged helix-turn-helix transcriptional regulator [Pseudoduganella lutea]|uniref:MarR family transcriptional regulator n=1 Tax=Pseudoduganella lutea TaxID=321985 RepID=A0A4P6L7F6_9BURK|nr:MarR family winged helix-turn-helix transcriptional regulator [Pseudoduganella lutea]QBE66862.1 MarR family transcriptional regulator [Pseudoduganella lutea]
MQQGVRSLDSLMAVLETFRKLDPDMNMPMAMSFLVIAQNDGISVKEVAEKVDMGMASVSRYVALFGKPGTGEKKGLGLVVSVEDPMERRRKTISLTAKGREVIAKLQGL